MKKFLLGLALMLSIAVAAQDTQVRVYYTQAYAEQTGKPTLHNYVENVVYYNYGNDPYKIKMYTVNGNIITYTQVSKAKTGYTVGNQQYTGAYFEGTNGANPFIQVFKDPELGMRIIFSEDLSVQLLP